MKLVSCILLFSLKEEIKKIKKQINISQALKYQEQKSRETDKERKKRNLKTLKKTKPTQPYKIVRQKVNKHPSKKPINKMHQKLCKKACVIST